MSQAEIIKTLKLKTNAVKRLHKEFNYYEKEREKEQTKVDKLKADGADIHDVKQAVSCWYMAFYRGVSFEPGPRRQHLINLSSIHRRMY